MQVTLRPHQRKAVQDLGNGKILYGGVGVGKSIAALAYYYEKVCGGDLKSIPSMEQPRDLYIITTAKKRDELDWQSDAVKLGLGAHDDSLDGVKVTVDSWNNLGKYKGVYGAFFIFDEQRLVGSGAWTKAFIHLARRNQWVLLSATPGDTWLDYIPVFVANGYYKNRTEFKRRHVVYNTYSKFPKVDRYVETGTLLKHRASLLVHMPYERHTTRRSQDVLVEFDSELFDKVKEQRWHVYEERPLRDVAEMFSVMRKVVNSHPSRLERLATLLVSHPRLIVFYNFDYELEILRSLRRPVGLPPVGSPSTTSVELSAFQSSSREPNPRSSTKKTALNTISPSGLTVAEWNGHLHQPVPDAQNWVYLVQYQAGAEGWNCITTDAMVFYSLPYSYKLYEQAHGRIDRLNTPFTDLFYYRLVSRSFIDRAIAAALQKKMQFSEGAFRTLWDGSG